ncbi:flagellar hook capping FlgD N-terminal domain-containing protein [Aestuariivita boseongensis]|uniref:flagellar hook capping FlgD N-terminal domain-containing protein n=1 Tax=Aestuariivita boseongensis TaxID=1470562 RepID=UPI0006811D01|nr:flagellar hook capping FlgD N-terminal domain-containing protein [Aestuariivita boseongensis]
MTIVPVISNAVSAANSSAATTASSNATLASDFETFLQMLTVQARYQDPLDPISSSDYAAQLAQFSMVEQQVFTNDQLTALTRALGGGEINTLANWVGMEVRAPAAANFDGTPITIAPNPAARADRVQLVIYNDFGTEVGRRTLPLSAENYLWDGRDQRGQVLGNGTYRFEVESYEDGELILSDPAQIYARVTEAQLVGQETVLKLDGGSYVTPDQVTALREGA